MPVLPVLWRMERNGVLLDRQKLEAQSHELGKEILELEQKAYEAAGQPFNLGSPKQIQEILFERQKLPVKKKTPSGQPSTDEDSLAELALDHPLPQADPRAPRALEAQVDLHRQAAEQHQPGHRARAHHLLADHRGHRPALVQRSQPAEHPDPHRRRAGASASASSPRRASKIVSADYSQIELRIMAHLSGDENLRRAFARRRGRAPRDRGRGFRRPFGASRF